MENVKSNQSTPKGQKAGFYMMSLGLLFVLIFLLTVYIPISFAPDAEFVGLTVIFRRNAISMLALICAVISWFLMKRQQYKWRGVTNPPHKIKAIKNENYEYLTFLTTYIIPLICMDLSNLRYVIILILLLLIIGRIFIKMDLYYGNPTLALMGYRLYRAEIEDFDSPDGVILITKNKLFKDSSFKWIEIDKYVWLAKEVSK